MKDEPLTVHVTEDNVVQQSARLREYLRNRKMTGGHTWGKMNKFLGYKNSSSASTICHSQNQAAISLKSLAKYAKLLNCRIEVTIIPDP